MEDGSDQRTAEGIVPRQLRLPLLLGMTGWAIILGGVALITWSWIPAAVWGLTVTAGMAGVTSQDRSNGR